MFKVSVGVNEFAHKLTIAGKCIDSKPVIPIMGSLLIDKSPQGFIMSATNSEMRVDIPVELNVEDGEFEPFCIDYTKLSNAVSTLERGTNIVFEIDDKKAVVNHSAGKFAVPMDNKAKDYPVSVKPENEEGYFSFTCNGAALIRNLNMAKPCMSEDKTRPFICGVCLDVFENTFNVVSTSGMLVFCKKNEPMTTSDGNPINRKLIIPSSVLSAVIGIFANSEEITIETDLKRIYFIDENGLKHTIRMVEGEYPNYLKLIPECEMSDIVVNKKSLESALRRASIFTDSKVNLISLTKTGSELFIAGCDMLYATSFNENLSILNENTLADGFKIGCNLVYLYDVLSAIETESVKFKFSEPSKVFMVEEENGDDEKILLLAPMKI